MTIPLLSFLTTVRINFTIRDAGQLRCPLIDPNIDAGEQLYATLYGPNGSQKQYFYGADAWQATDPDGGAQNYTTSDGNILGRTGVGKYYLETNADISGDWSFQIIYVAPAGGVQTGSFSVALDPSL